MKLAIPALVAAALAVGAAAASDARACGFFDYREIRPAKPKPVPVAANDRIAGADQRLEEENLAVAGREVLLAFPRIRGTAAGASPLETRALRILSLAVVRGDGALAGVQGFSGGTAQARADNVAWAVRTLRGIEAQRPGDPAAVADLGEALARSHGDEDAAFTLLTDLATRDLVGSAHAYATLARLRGARGDAAGTREALALCERMTRSPSIVCKAPDARVASRD